MEQTGFEQNEDLLCKKCGRIMSSNASDSVAQICEACRSEYLQLRVPKKIIVISVLIGILIVYQCVTALPKGIEYRKLLYQAEQAYDDKHFAVAIANYEEASKLTDLDSEADSHQFISYVRNYEYDLAETIYNEQLVGTETSSDALYNDIDNALTELNDYYDVSAEFYEFLDNSYVYTLDELITETEAFINTYPDEYYTHSVLSDLYFEFGDYQRAIDELNKVMAIKPSLSSVTNLSLAASYRQLGEFEKAYDAINQSLSQNKDDIAALCSYSRTLIKEKRFEESLTYLQEINPLLTSEPYYKESLALAYHFNGMTTERDLLVQELQDVDQYDTTFLLEVINNQTNLYN